MRGVALGFQARPAKNAHRVQKTAVTLKRLMDRFSQVQLATLIDKAPEGEAWVHEIKFDGYRLLGFAAGGATCLRTRNGNDWTDRFPSIVTALEKLRVNSAVLDMEAVLLDPQGKSSFQALQGALGEGGNPGKIVAHVFDLLHLDGKDLTKLPLTERKEKLEALLPKAEGNGVPCTGLSRRSCAKSPLPSGPRTDASAIPPFKVSAKIRMRPK